MTKMQLSLLCVTGKRRPECLFEETTSLLPSRTRQLIQLPPRGRRCSSSHLFEREASRECPVPHGVLLHDAPHISKVCCNSPFLHPDRGPPGHDA